MNDKEPFFDPRLVSPAGICKTIGDRGRRLRLQRSMRQVELAQAVGVTQATIGRFERTGRVGFDVLVRIAVALGAEEGLAALFAATPVRTIDEVVASAAPRMRARRR